MLQRDIDKALLRRKLATEKSHELIELTRFRLSSQEQKILLHMISRIEQEDLASQLYEYDIEELCGSCGLEVKRDKADEALIVAVKHIADKSIWVDLGDGQTTLLRWIEKVSIHHARRTLTVRFDADMKPFLFQLAQQLDSRFEPPELPAAGEQPRNSKR